MNLNASRSCVPSYLQEAHLQSVRHYAELLVTGKVHTALQSEQLPDIEEDPAAPITTETTEKPTTTKKSSNLEDLTPEPTTAVETTTKPIPTTGANLEDATTTMKIISGGSTGSPLGSTTFAAGGSPGLPDIEEDPGAPASGGGGLPDIEEDPGAPAGSIAAPSGNNFDVDIQNNLGSNNNGNNVFNNNFDFSNNDLENENNNFDNNDFEENENNNFEENEEKEDNAETATEKPASGGLPDIEEDPAAPTTKKPTTTKKPASGGLPDIEEDPAAPTTTTTKETTTTEKPASGGLEDMTPEPTTTKTTTTGALPTTGVNLEDATTSRAGFNPFSTSNNIAGTTGVLSTTAAPDGNSGSPGAGGLPDIEEGILPPGAATTQETTAT